MRLTLLLNRYAPAFERFGSQISAIHFIGSSKPWHSIPYRAPGTRIGSGFSASQTQIQTLSQNQAQVQIADKSFTESQSISQVSVQQAYDYASLVDRWYAVYDSHYRSQALVSGSLSDFDVKNCMAVWDKHAVPGTQQPNCSAGIQAVWGLFGSSVGLLDQKRLAIERIESARGRQGVYKHMPL